MYMHTYTHTESPDHPRMAYRRKQGLSRSSTFKEEIHHPSSDHDNNLNLHPASPDLSSDPSSSVATLSVSSPPSSLAAQAIRFSTKRRDSSLSSTLANGDDSAFSSDRHGSKVFDRAYMVDSDSTESQSNSGFWGVIARKAKAILEDDDGFQTNHMPDNRGMGAQQQPYYPAAADPFRKMENPTLRKGLDAITASINQLGDTFEKAFEESRVIMENKAADFKLQMKRKGGNYEDTNQATTGLNNSWHQPLPRASQQLNPTKHENQLKASRDVAMATAAKAKLLLRELKTVKADLAFAKQRCSQLEEENKILREGREKGHNGADDDLIRLQLETLLAEKARLAHENEICARENCFLREIVEYHNLTMQDVVYLDETTEEVTEVYPISEDGVSRILSGSTSPASPVSPESPSPELPSEHSPETTLNQVSEMVCSSNISSVPKEDGPARPSSRSSS